MAQNSAPNQICAQPISSLIDVGAPIEGNERAGRLDNDHHGDLEKRRLKIFVQDKGQQVEHRPEGGVQHVSPNIGGSCLLLISIRFQVISFF